MLPSSSAERHWGALMPSGGNNVELANFDSVTPVIFGISRLMSCGPTSYPIVTLRQCATGTARKDG